MVGLAYDRNLVSMSILRQEHLENRMRERSVSRTTTARDKMGLKQ